MRLLILGADGMLGMGIRQAFQKSALHLSLSARRETDFTFGSHEHFLDTPLEPISFSSDTDLSHYEYVINCIGVIKPRIDESSSESVREAIEINSTFPHLLSEAAKNSGTRVIQIATDCVYSGESGEYSEESAHDPLDVYGKTKSLGEVADEHFLNLRTSIIGAEHDRVSSLFEWFKNQGIGAELKGFSNHMWNGVSTFHFGKIVHGIVHQSNFISGTHHVLPSNMISKFDLLNLFMQKLDRSDLSIERFEAPKVINRTLSTDNPSLNETLWSQAGYETPPSIGQIVEEMPSTATES